LGTSGDGFFLRYACCRTGQRGERRRTGIGGGGGGGEERGRGGGGARGGGGGGGGGGETARETEARAARAGGAARAHGLFFLSCSPSRLRNAPCFPPLSPPPPTHPPLPPSTSSFCSLSLSLSPTQQLKTGFDISHRLFLLRRVRHKKDTMSRRTGVSLRKTPSNEVARGDGPGGSSALGGGESERNTWSCLTGVSVYGVERRLAGNKMMKEWSGRGSRKDMKNRRENK